MGAWPLALAVAAVWLAHPLQAEFVSYIVQRIESLAGQWYLLTLYGFIRPAEGPAAGRDRPIPPAVRDAGSRGERERLREQAW